MKKTLLSAPNSGGNSENKRWLPLAAAVLLAVVAWLLVPGVGPSVLGPDSSEYSGVVDEDLLAQLDGLEVVDWVDAPKYQRSFFGDGWADLDGDGCDTRNEILARDLDAVVYRKGTGNCVVQFGEFEEPYTGEFTEFERGAGTSELVQIDHVVALGNAWYAGAYQWDTKTRLEFANDPLNLLAVDGDANYDKAALTADQWLPYDPEFHCEFAARQVMVKARWNLTVKRKEAQTLRDILEGCPPVVISE